MTSVIQLRETDIIDPAIGAHYAFHSSFGAISTRLHRHDFYEVFLINAGRVQHHINGAKVDLEAGALVFIRPADAHYYQQAGTADCQLLNLALPAATIHALFAYLGNDFDAHRLLEPTLPCTVWLEASDRLALCAGFEHWNSVLAYNSASSRLALRALLVGIFTRYFAQPMTGMVQTGLEWLDAACHAMHQPEHFAAGVERLQALAGCSPEHLSRTFRRYLHMTPTLYVNQLRLDYAARRLVHSDLPIADVALEVGFENLSHFYHLFQKRFHSSPLQYRRSHQKQVIP